MRVVFQILTDSYTWAYPFMAASAWIEVSGLAIWAFDLWMSMGRRPRAAPSCCSVDARRARWRHRGSVPRNHSRLS
jgi:hypothetical protein